MSFVWNKNPEYVSENYNIVDLLLMDHKYLKECCKIFKNSDDKKLKLKYAKSFIDTLKKHSKSEEKVVYDALVDIQNFRDIILEGEIEHDICNSRISHISRKISSTKVYNDKVEMQMKVLAEMVSHHLEEEEKNLFPLMRRSFSSEVLNQMGFQYMKVRGYTPRDLQEYPKLQKTLSNFKGVSTRLSPKYVENVHLAFKR